MPPHVPRVPLIASGHFLSNVSAILLVFEMCLMRFAYDWHLLRVGGVRLAIFDECISVLACFLNACRVCLFCYTSISLFFLQKPLKNTCFCRLFLRSLAPFWFVLGEINFKNLDPVETKPTLLKKTYTRNETFQKVMKNN